MNNSQKLPVNLMSRDAYKAVKHMDKVQMTEYLARVYHRGYEAGVKAASKQHPDDHADEK